MVNSRKLYIILILLVLFSSSILSAQSTKFKQKLSWVEDKNAFDYKVEIRGVETSRSLAFTNDPYVLLVGALGGILGYLIFDFENYFGFPVDTGAVSVILVGVLGRLLFNKENTYNKKILIF